MKSFLTVLVSWLLLLGISAQVTPLSNPTITGTTNVNGPFSFNRGAYAFALQAATGNALNVDSAGILTINSANGTASFNANTRTLNSSSGAAVFDWSNSADVFVNSTGQWQFKISSVSKALFNNAGLHLTAAGTTGTSGASMGRMLYVSDAGNPGIMLERTGATSGKYSLVTQASGDLQFYDELNLRSVLNLRKTGGVDIPQSLYVATGINWPIAASDVGLARVTSPLALRVTNASSGYGNLQAQSIHTGGTLLPVYMTAWDANYGGIWLGANATTATNTNFSFFGNQTDIYYNAGSSVNFRVLNSPRLILDTTGPMFTHPSSTLVKINNEIAGAGNSTLLFTQAGVSKFQWQFDNGSASFYFHNYVAGAQTFFVGGASNVVTFTNAPVFNTALGVASGGTGRAKSPTFSAHKNGTDQTAVVTSNYTLVTFPTEDWDTDNYFASSRFTPLVAGKYRITGMVGVSGGGGGYSVFAIVYKNGVSHKSLSQENNDGGVGGSCLVSANGTTDYFEIYTWQNSGANMTILGASDRTYFQAEIVGN